MSWVALHTAQLVGQGRRLPHLAPRLVLGAVPGASILDNMTGVTKAHGKGEYHLAVKRQGVVLKESAKICMLSIKMVWVRGVCCKHW